MQGYFFKTILIQGEIMARNMGFDFGMDDATTCFKRKNRWLFIIEGISADNSPQGVNSLPPSKASRPNVSYKEIEAQHLNETIYFPGKLDWKPITLTLYEIKKNDHPVFEWLKLQIDPEKGTSGPSCNGFKKPNARLELYNGCGDVLETWIFEAIWPQTIEFGDVDMSSSDIITCEITLRFDRAYIKK